MEVYGGKYYVGTLCGQMYRGDLREERAEVFVPPGPGPRIVGGIEATATRLVVARAATGQAHVFNRFTGKLVASFYNGHEDESIVNDVAVTPDGDAYLTEFIGSKLYRIPPPRISRHRAKLQTLPVFLSFRGTAFPVQEGSANGIVATPDGRFLVVAHYGAGSSTGSGSMTSESLRSTCRAGACRPRRHGPEQRRRVVRRRAREGADHRDPAEQPLHPGRIVSRTTSPLFRCPTAVDIAGDRLLVSNSQYCSDEIVLPVPADECPDSLGGAQNSRAAAGSSMIAATSER